MSILHDILAMKQNYTLRMGFRDPDFVIIPWKQVDELQALFDECTTFNPDRPPISFKRMMDQGDVRISGVPIFRGAELGAGSYFR